MHFSRLRREAEQQFRNLGQDIEARCRGYVEYAATDCRARVNGLAEELETDGRGLLTEVQEDCQEEERRREGLGNLERKKTLV